MKRLGSDFFLREATEVAPQLIGKLLCRKTDGEIVKLRIVETECYYGEQDTACHAHRGRTKRTAIMYEPGGRAYIYLCYGIHALLNVVTGPEDFPQAVLIRGVLGAIGPGRVTKKLDIDCTQNGLDFASSDILWLEDDGAPPCYETARRVGIDYAAKADRDRLWRFVAPPECYGL